jgi:hypothetical protein
VTALTVVTDGKSIPSVVDGEFARWFNDISPDDFDRVWSDSVLRDKIEARLRHPGGMHEWLMVARANTFKRWGITAEQISNLRSSIPDIVFINPSGSHGMTGSGKAHKELIRMIDSSPDYETFQRRLKNWANYRLSGGVDDLPEGLR